MATVTESDIKELKELITNLGENLSIRMKFLEDGQKSLENGQKSLENGQKSLEIGQKSLENGQKSLEIGQKSLEDGQKSLEDGQKSLENGQKSLEIGQARIEGCLDEWKPSIHKITDLTEKVGELKNWKQVGLVFITAMVSSVFSGTIGGVIGWLIRSGKA